MFHNLLDLQKNIVFFILLIILFSCKKEVKINRLNSKVKSSIQYAKGFDIIEVNGIKKLIIKSPYQNSDKVSTYYLYKNINKLPIHSLTNTKSNSLKIPVEKIVPTSTTHIPMIELLNAEKTIVGFPFAKYISSEKTRKLIDEGKIKEIGKESSLNTEILLDLKPELVIGFSVSGSDKSLHTVQKSGIPVIYNGDWLEETPLGRAEWIKFFGALLDKEKEADSIFKQIENNYLQAKQIALQSNKKPTVLSGAMMNKNTWNLPAGKSYVAQFFKDASLNYLWEKTTGNGSLSLSFESVFEKGQQANFWFSPGYFSTKKQMINNNRLYEKFTAFQQDNVYTTSTKKGKTGGIIYYELATTRPDLVLKDLIKITKPNLLADYKLTFFEKMR